MTFNDNLIDQYPLLKSWYYKSQGVRLNSLSETALYRICQAMSITGREATRVWCSAIDNFLRASQEPVRDFVEIDSLASNFNAPFLEILGTLSENSARSGEGRKAFKSLQSLATKTSLSAIRFLSAWCAFNSGDVHSCIDECEKENEPNGPIYTLLGQALLESGNPNEGIAALNVATSLCPQDPLPFFQLVKAYMVLEQTRPAIDAISKCRELCGNNIEIECLSALIVILDKGANNSFANETAQRLRELFENDPGNVDLLVLGFDVFETLNDHNSIAEFFYKADFEKITTTRNFESKIAKMLKIVGQKGWFGLAKILTENLTHLKNADISH